MRARKPRLAEEKDVVRLQEFVVSHDMVEEAMAYVREQHGDKPLLELTVADINAILGVLNQRRSERRRKEDPKPLSYYQGLWGPK
jgi:hypothetical protein